jgi:hypothetical protein
MTGPARTTGARSPMASEDQNSGPRTERRLANALRWLAWRSHQWRAMDGLGWLAGRSHQWWAMADSVAAGTAQEWGLGDGEPSGTDLGAVRRWRALDRDGRTSWRYRQ